MDAAALARRLRRPASEPTVWLPAPVAGRQWCLLSAALIVVDFNCLCKHGTENDAIWLATGIFVLIVNIFISLLNIFSQW